MIVYAKKQIYETNINHKIFINSYNKIGDAMKKLLKELYEDAKNIRGKGCSC